MITMTTPGTTVLGAAEHFAEMASDTLVLKNVMEETLERDHAPPGGMG